MPMNQPEMERKIRQHDADIGAIYEMLEVVQAKQTEHDGRFDGIDGRLTGIDGRLVELSGKFGEMSGTLTEVLEIVRGGRARE